MAAVFHGLVIRNNLLFCFPLQTWTFYHLANAPAHSWVTGKEIEEGKKRTWTFSVLHLLGLHRLVGRELVALPASSPESREEHRPSPTRSWRIFFLPISVFSLKHETFLRQAKWLQVAWKQMSRQVARYPDAATSPPLSDCFRGEPGCSLPESHDNLIVNLLLCRWCKSCRCQV